MVDAYIHLINYAKKPEVNNEVVPTNQDFAYGPENKDGNSSIILNSANSSKSLLSVISNQTKAMKLVFLSLQGLFI